MGLDMYLIGENSEQLAYWRKCTEVHDWFEQRTTFNSNNDMSLVTHAQLVELRGLCQSIQKNISLRHRLPPLGGIKYDKEEYKQMLKQTVANLVMPISMAEDGLAIYYNADW